MSNENILLRMVGMTKTFGGIKVLDNVDFELKAGEVHILSGENGAGKSTLMKILTGIYTATEGKILIDGNECSFSKTKESEAAGIAIIHQELSLCPTITVAENMFLGNEKRKGRSIFLDRKAMREGCEEVFHRIGCKINLNEKIGNLTIAQQQLVQIARALSQNARILIMDEPFSSLSDEESDNLFVIMEKLRNEGTGIIYIDHRIDNFYKIGDRVTVLRDGQYIGTRNVADVTRDEIISMMVGRELNDIYPKYNKVQDEVVMRVSDLNNKKVHHVGFELHRGEILGLGGLVGAGRSEILRAIFGADRKDSGDIEVAGQKIHVKKPTQAIENRIAYIPEDRKREGLVLLRSVEFNAGLVTLKQLSRGGFINAAKERAEVKKQVDNLNIKLGSTRNLITSLSGGNQQKVVISKWLMEEKIDVLIMDEPTRGIDVGAKYEIYKLMSDLANEGIGIILVTSELPELINLADRVLVIRNGEISGEVTKENMTQESIMHLSV